MDRPARPLLLVTVRGKTTGDEATPTVDSLIKKLTGTGSWTVDLCEVDREIPTTFNDRMDAARAVVITTESLTKAQLAGTPIAEIATRCRQSGVPAYAVAESCALNLFERRILDFEAVLDLTDGDDEIQWTAEELLTALES